MNAPDEHWLLVKNLWLPIEDDLDTLGAIGEDAREKIDSMAGRLNSSIIDQLHYLRMERNALIHNNKPLHDHNLWKKTALSVRETIRSASAQGGGAAVTAPLPTRSFKDLIVMLIWLAIWGIGSWYMMEFCNFLFTKVNKFSFAWWVIGALWLLCWPGIFIAGFVGGIISMVANGLYWLLTYFISNPI